MFGVTDGLCLQGPRLFLFFLLWPVGCCLQTCYLMVIIWQLLLQMTHSHSRYRNRKEGTDKKTFSSRNCLLIQNMKVLQYTSLYVSWWRIRHVPISSWSLMEATRISMAGSCQSELIINSGWLRFLGMKTPLLNILKKTKEGHHWVNMEPWRPRLKLGFTRRCSAPRGWVQLSVFSFALTITHGQYKINMECMHAPSINGWTEGWGKEGMSDLYISWYLLLQGGHFEFHCGN